MRETNHNVFIRVEKSQIMSMLRKMFIKTHLKNEIFFHKLQVPTLDYAHRITGTLVKNMCANKITTKM